MTAAKIGLGDTAVQVACALAEAFFGTKDAAGRVRVPLRQAHLLASGRVDLWDRWRELPEPSRQFVGRLLRLRHNELASLEAFLKAARRLAASPEAPYALPPEVPLAQVEEVFSQHGQEPLALAGQLLAEMEAEQHTRRTPRPVAGPGEWVTGWRDSTRLRLPERLAGAEVAPVKVRTAAAEPELKVSCQELKELAAEIDRAFGQATADGKGWRHQTLSGLFAGLRDEEAIPVDRLLLAPGRLGLLNAPTGVGKTVLTQVLAVHCQRIGVPVGIVVTNINSVLETAEVIRDALTRLGEPGVCAPLISPRRLHEKALLAAETDRWDRTDLLGYGCALAAHVVDGPTPAPGREPCDTLRPAPKPQEPAPHEQQQKQQREEGAERERHSCPWRGACGRHRLLRLAATADILITNHHNLLSGQVPVPVEIGGVVMDRVSVLEFLLRRCALVVVDEIDQFQSSAVDTNTRNLLLAVKGMPDDDLPLSRLEVDRAALPAAADRLVLPALTRTRFLADQLLNYALERKLWFEADRERPSAGWYLPGTSDRMLLAHLFAVAIDAPEVPPAIYQHFNALFPDETGPVPPDLGEDLRQLRELLAQAVSNDSGTDRIDEVWSDLDSMLRARVSSDDERTKVVNGLLLRAWLGALNQALLRLTYAVSTPETDLPAARQLADKLGVFVQHAVIPYGPLGYLLFGFRIDRAEEPRPSGRLSVQAIGGDPHTTTAQLGGTIALATCGTERAVLGLSATGFFPGAAREHLHSPVTWAMTDAASGAVTAAAGQVLGEGFTPIRISGKPAGAKKQAVIDLGTRMWEQHLEAHIQALQADPTRADRARVLLVVNSYEQCALLAQGMALSTDPRRLAVAVPAGAGSHQRLATPTGALRLTAEEFERFAHHSGVDVLIAPLARVARGLNILIPGGQRSAISQVWVCVRPFVQLTEPAEMFASINAFAVGHGKPGPDPAAVLADQRRAAHRRLGLLLGSDPRFAMLPKPLKTEVIAGMLVDFIQLAGRARRGGTPVELYLVDNAFHDTRLASDLPGLLRTHYDNLPPAERSGMRRIYGTTLTSLLSLAGVPTTEET